MAFAAPAMMVASAAMSVAGGIMGAQGARQQAAGQAESLQAQARASEFNASMLETRAQEAERNRLIAYEKAEGEARDVRVKNRAVIGQVRAAYGANGLSMDGSPLDVLQATAVEQELDVAKVLYAGDLAGLEQTDRAASFRQQKELALMGASSAMRASSRAIEAGEIGAATAMLSGISGAVRSFTPTPTMRTG